MPYIQELTKQQHEKLDRIYLPDLQSHSVQILKRKYSLFFVSHYPTSLL